MIALLVFRHSIPVATVPYQAVSNITLGNLLAETPKADGFEKIMKEIGFVTKHSAK